jgi:hypothetical protein
MDFIPERTRLHRLIGAELGEVPTWICSNARGGISVADLLPGGIFAVGSGGCSALALMIGFWVLPVAVVLIACSLVARREVHALKMIERKCRARRRRHECLACGQSLGSQTDEYVCDVCNARLQHD